jgi:hypothetical protein
MTLNKNANKKSRLNGDSLGEDDYRKTSRAPSPHPSEDGCVGYGRAHNQTGILSHIQVLVRAAFEIV